MKTLVFSFIILVNFFFTPLLGQKCDLLLSRPNWSPDSVINLFKQTTKYGSTYKVTKRENGLIVEHKNIFNQVSNNYFYFENDVLKIHHHDYAYDSVQKDPVKYFLNYVNKLNKIPINDLQLYITYKGQTFTNFDTKNVDKAISLQGAQLHAISKLYGYYTELVLLYINNEYHVHAIFEYNHRDTNVKKDSPYYQWYKSVKSKLNISDINFI